MKMGNLPKLWMISVPMLIWQVIQVITHPSCRHFQIIVSEPDIGIGISIRLTIVSLPTPVPAPRPLARSPISRNQSKPSRPKKLKQLSERLRSLSRPFHPFLSDPACAPFSSPSNIMKREAQKRRDENTTDGKEKE